MAETKRSERITLAEARTEAAEVAAWKCESCDVLIEDGRHCWQCASYWKDVDNGVFDRLYNEDWP